MSASADPRLIWSAKPVATAAVSKAMAAAADAVVAAAAADAAWLAPLPTAELRPLRRMLSMPSPNPPLPALRAGEGELSAK